jgi:hypothetical protein
MFVFALSLGMVVLGAPAAFAANPMHAHNRTLTAPDARAHGIDATSMHHITPVAPQEHVDPFASLLLG